MLGAKVSDLYGSLAGNFFRVTFAGREKSAVRAKGFWNEPKGEVFPARRAAIRTITGCGVRVERFHRSSFAQRALGLGLN